MAGQLNNHEGLDNCIMTEYPLITHLSANKLRKN